MAGGKSSGIGGLTWNKRKEQWQGQWFNEVGERKTKLLGRDLDAAKLVFLKILRDRDLSKAGLGVFARQSKTLREIKEKYLGDLNRHASHRHFKHVAAHLEEIIPKLRCGSVANLTVAMVVRYRESLQERTGKEKLSNETINKKISALVAMLNWAARTELIARNPIGDRKIKKLKIRGNKTRKRHVLTRDEWNHLCAAAIDYDKKWGGYQDRIPQAVILKILINTGFRPGEAYQLRWMDLKIEDGRWRLVLREEYTKTDDVRANPIPNDLADELAELRTIHGHYLNRLPRLEEHILLSPKGIPWADRGHTPAVLNWLNRLIKSVGESRIKKRYEDGTTIDLYSFRHTFCTWLRQARVPYDDARDLMGHSDDLITREIYTSQDGLGDIKAAAIDKLVDFMNS